MPTTVYPPAGHNRRGPGAEGPESTDTSASHRVCSGPARQRAGAVLPRRGDQAAHVQRGREEGDLQAVAAHGLQVSTLDQSSKTRWGEVQDKTRN